MVQYSLKPLLKRASIVWLPSNITRFELLNVSVIDTLLTSTSDTMSGTGFHPLERLVHIAPTRFSQAVGSSWYFMFLSGPEHLSKCLIEHNLGPKNCGLCSVKPLARSLFLPTVFRYSAIHSRSKWFWEYSSASLIVYSTNHLLNKTLLQKSEFGKLTKPCKSTSFMISYA